MNDKPLRFAALIRVSTERQERRGESLNTQGKQIEAAVESLGGKITKKYAGSQHATAGHEQHLVDQLLADAQKKVKPFDAIMVADPTRWSRDNARSKAGLDILRKQGIRFFALTTEHDLHDPNACLFLGLSAEIGEYLASTQTKKSVENKIQRAKRGIPCCNLPFGRTYDKESGRWGINLKDQAIILDCATRYLRGESIKNLAAEIHMNSSNLHMILTKRCGEIWTQEFKWKEIHEVVETKVPRLLPEATIKKILKRVAMQRTFVRGKNKHKYLLAGKVFCETCGRSLSPQTASGVRYYRPAVACKCMTGGVRADDLERHVARQLFATMGNPQAIAEAIEEARPNKEQLVERTKRLEKIENELRKIKNGLARILDLIVRETISDADAETKLRSLKERQSKLEDEQEQLTTALQAIPNRKNIERLSAKLTAKIQGFKHDFESMTWEQCREMVLQAFDGMTENNRPMGVYIADIPGHKYERPRPWAYTVRGHFAVDFGGNTGLNEDVWEDWKEGDDLVKESPSY